MKFEVKQDRGLFILLIDGEKILEDQKLSMIVNKIESYLKMRYLKEEVKENKGLGSFFQ